MMCNVVWVESVTPDGNVIISNGTCSPGGTEESSIDYVKYLYRQSGLPVFAVLHVQMNIDYDEADNFPPIHHKLHKLVCPVCTKEVNTSLDWLRGCCEEHHNQVMQNA
jgi:hypothetical protein